MPGKPLDPQNLQRDLGYILGGTLYHARFASICAPRLGLRVLEAGCGSGKFGLWYAWRSADVTLLDIDPGVLVYTRALRDLMEKTLQDDPGIHQLSWVKIVEGSIFNLSRLYPDAPYDFVFNEGVPQHWPSSDWRRQHSINQMVAVTKPCGVVCVMGSNGLCPDMVQYAQQVSHTYSHMPNRQQPWLPEELVRRMERAGLRGIEVAPVEASEWEKSRLLVGWGRKPE